MFYVENGPVYEFKNVDIFLKKVLESEVPTVGKRKGGKSFKYCNVPCSFDIESTSYSEHYSIFGFMYIWQFGINGISIYGRKWSEFIELLNKLQSVLGLGEEKRLICYIENIQFEYHFMQPLLEWEDVFLMNETTPLYAICKQGVEFRCSYALTNMSLFSIGQSLKKYKCEKKIGDLDYSKIRHYNTPITETELGYCINDIRVVMCKIKELIENSNNNIGYLPYTQTGYVRRECRKAIIRDRKAKALVRSLKISGLKEYKMLREAFQGGYTHANFYNSERTVYDVISMDIRSSYPTVCLSESYPMGNGREVQVESYEDFQRYIDCYCCVFEIAFYGVELKEGKGACPISKSKCGLIENPVIDNGRVFKCDMLQTTITNVDYEIYKDFYNIEHESVGTMYVYQKGYLPKPLIDVILQYYEIKQTTPKNTEAYDMAKALLNSIYGMMAMLIIRNLELSEEEQEEIIRKYNEDNNRFNWYPWGVFISAYARKNLFMILDILGDDFVYCDTDSLKFTNASRYTEVFNQYNIMIKEKIDCVLDFYNIDTQKACAGGKQIGEWAFDGEYKRFKTLGAKRYIMEYSDNEMNEKNAGKIKSIIAGLGEEERDNYFNSVSDPFETFSENLDIPKEQARKKVVTYIDYPITKAVTDYLGNTAIVTEESGVYFEETNFSFKEMENKALLFVLGKAKDNYTMTI